MENSWIIQSIYEFQYFNCPSCLYKNHSKQEFVNHACDFHPEYIKYLLNISDDSIKDIEFPWNIHKKEIETKENVFVNLQSEELGELVRIDNSTPKESIDNSFIDYISGNNSVLEPVDQGRI